MAEVVAARERQSFADVADIDEFVATLERFERGEISPDAWRKFRLVRGTYGQRQDDVQMLRVKIPQGVLSAGQVESLAEVAETLQRQAEQKLLEDAYFLVESLHSQFILVEAALQAELDARASA